MKNSEELVEIAAIHLSEENYEKGLMYLNMVIAFAPDNPDAYFFRGGTLSTLGKHEQALLDAIGKYEISKMDLITALVKRINIRIPSNPITKQEIIQQIKDDLEL